MKEKEPGREKDAIRRLEAKFAQSGQRRSAFAVILVHNHGHPHVLLLKSDNNSWDLYVYYRMIVICMRRAIKYLNTLLLCIVDLEDM